MNEFGKLVPGHDASVNDASQEWVSINSHLLHDLYIPRLKAASFVEYSGLLMWLISENYAPKCLAIMPRAESDTLPPFVMPS